MTGHPRRQAWPQVSAFFRAVIEAFLYSDPADGLHHQVVDMPQIRAPCYVVPLALAAAVVLAACGGGADYSLLRDVPPAPSHPPANCSPVARAAAAEAPPSVTAVVGGLMSDPSGPRWLIFVAQ